MKFTIESVSKMTGISAATLRNWEKRYGFPHPERSQGGHRFYCQNDIEFLKNASAWVEQGQGLGEIARLYKEKGCTETIKTMINPAIIDDVCYRTTLIYDSLLKFDQTALLQHYIVLNAKLGPEQMFERVFEQILYRVAKESKQGLISISQEHFISAFIRMKLSTYLAMDFPASQNHKILATTLSEERCEGGLMVVASHLKFRGYPVFYFGTGLPMAGLQEVVEEVKPDVVCLSYSAVDRIAADLELLHSIPVPICIGGAALRHPEITEIMSKASPGVYFCQKATGREAAEFVEMVCCRK